MVGISWRRKLIIKYRGEDKEESAKISIEFIYRVMSN